MKKNFLKRLKRLFCRFNIHLSGVCKNGCFVCDCGKVLDVYTKYPYTRKQIRYMSPEEFESKEKEILAMLAKGLIK